MSHFRYCKLTGDWVIIAENRLHKPDYTRDISKENYDDIDTCPFEYGNEHISANEIYAIRDKESKKNEMGWKTRVIPNLYNALSIESEKKSESIGLFERQSGFGAHEILIETPHHHITMNNYKVEEFENYLNTIINRINDLTKDKRIEHIQVFKNCGKNAGASMNHPHTQIIATPFIPKQTVKRIELQREYYNLHNRGILEDMVNEELRLNERVIYENGTFIVFAPYASNYSFELLIAPKNNIGAFETFKPFHVADLANALKNTYKKLYRELGTDFAFNMLFHNMPPLSAQNDISFFYQMENFCRFYIQITPRIYHLAGFELSTGMHINPVSPELAASQLKNES